MEMFVSSYVNVLYIYPDSVFKSVPPNDSEPTWQTNMLYSDSFPNLCKWNYLYGNLPFYKTQVNHFMARDESSGAKIIPKCILWMRGLVWALRHPFH